MAVADQRREPAGDGQCAGRGVVFIGLAGQDAAFICVALVLVLGAGGGVGVDDHVLVVDHGGGVVAQCRQCPAVVAAGAVEGLLKLRGTGASGLSVAK